MQYRYFICDVFTETRFHGNQLAILPEAAGLDARQMQTIAREFNFSESTFVLPSARWTRKVRIFTPTQELAFAGHPNVGTAFALARDGSFGQLQANTIVTFEEAAGPVPIQIRRESDGRIWCELKAPQPLTLGDIVDVKDVARALSLNPQDIVTDTHPPRHAGVGLPFLIVEVDGLEALQRARADVVALRKFEAAGRVPHVHLYTRSLDGNCDIRARMFAPLDGVPEDPATGSANCALAAMLTHYFPDDEGAFSWRIVQGVEMGRPSVLEARTRKDADGTSVWIGGYSVLVSEGTIYVDP